MNDFILPFTSIFFFLRHLLLGVWIAEIERGPSIYLFPSLNNHYWRRMKPRAETSTWIFPVGAGNSNTEASTCCFPGCTSAGCCNPKQVYDWNP